MSLKRETVIVNTSVPLIMPNRSDSVTFPMLKNSILASESVFSIEASLD